MRKWAAKFYRFSNTWTGTVVIVLMIIFFVAQAFVIPSGSMKNTLLIGDHLFVKKFAYGIPTPHIPFLEVPVLPDMDGDGHLIAGEGPKRGDIVIFRYPVNPKMHYVKRCIAVGGDEVMLINKVLFIRPHEGDAYIKANYPSDLITTFEGKMWVKDPYRKDFLAIHNDENVNDTSLYPEQLFNVEPRRVPEGEYFMMGDNRDHSQDSRFWGSVPYKYVEGKPWFIYFSWDSNYEIRWERMGRFVDTLEREIPVRKDPD